MTSQIEEIAIAIATEYVSRGCTAEMIEDGEIWDADVEWAERELGRQMSRSEYLELAAMVAELLEVEAMVTELLGR